MPQGREHGIVLFADIAGSTQIYERLGDRLAQKLVDEILSRLADTTRKNRGEVIKTIGDEIMCIFGDVDDAIRAAVEMNQDADHRAGTADPDLPEPQVAIGLHGGPLIRTRRDVFGDTVNVAARIVKLAKPQQILLTQPVAQSVQPASPGRIRYVDRYTIRGKSGEVTIQEYLWEPRDATVLLKRSELPKSAHAGLALTWGQNTIRVDSVRPAVSLGRQAHNELVLNYERVSRSHARIEYRRGKFLLIDHSSNGTYIQRPGEAPVFIKRDEAPLSGSGIISLGRIATPGSPGAVHFAVER
jgi:class 3 adenylate cyclase